VEAEDRLIARTLAGDLEAYGAIVDRHRTSVFNLAYRMLGSRDRADDVAQDAFLRAYNALRAFDTRRAFLPWILTITANLCRDDLRHRTRFPESELAPESQADDPRAHTDPYIAAEHGEMQATVHSAIGRLPATQRLVTVLIHLQGLSYEQVSEMLGQPVNTIKSHAHRARFRLRKLLAPHIEEKAP